MADRHLFEMSGFGVSYLGKVAVETEKTVLVSSLAHGSYRRVKCPSLHVIECDDPVHRLASARAVNKSYDAAEKQKRDELFQIVNERAEETRLTLEGKL